MESIGDRLKRVREERGYTIDQVARDTHITKRFILALEEENFDQFPGESYLLGFLRNYSHYLGLNEQETIGLYKNLRLQEEPAPISELLDDSKARRTKYLLVGLLVLLLFVGGGLVVYFTSSPQLPAQPGPQQTQVSQPQAPEAGRTIQFSGEFLEQIFLSEDRIQVSVSDLQGSFRLEQITNDNILLNVLGTPLALGILDTGLIDINGNGREDLRVIVRGSVPQDDGTLGVILRIDRFIESAQAITPIPQQPTTQQSPAQQPNQGSNQQTNQGILIGSPQSPARSIPVRTLVQQPQRQPFTLSLTFTAPAMFRYLNDQDQTQELFVSSGQSFQVPVANWVKLWISNGGAVQARIGTTQVVLGESGEVHTSRIGWADIPAGQPQRIELVPMF
jgi:cytoskeleton protein RodZ